MKKKYGGLMPKKPPLISKVPIDLSDYHGFSLREFLRNTSCVRMFDFSCHQTVQNVRGLVASQRDYSVPGSLVEFSFQSCCMCNATLSRSDVRCFGLD